MLIYVNKDETVLALLIRTFITLLLILSGQKGIFSIFNLLILIQNNSNDNNWSAMLLSR
uniref:Uncharacterized protein n=1 Tax=Anguilla anguilla TaxID=7936 RepID=A0A0E9T271_ANGAN